MPTIGSASNNPQGYFSTKVTDRAQRKESLKLMENIRKYDYGSVNVNYETVLNDVFTALESGVALPKSTQEMSLLHTEQMQEIVAAFNFAFNSMNTSVDELLKKHQNKDDSYNIDTLWQDTQSKAEDWDSDRFEDLKAAARGVFTENPQPLFEKAAAYPETMRRLVDVIDLPTQNDKGWNLASQAAKAGNPKLAKAFEKAGFGPNLHTKAVVDFAKAMTEGSNAEKSATLKELMGITPLS